MKTVIRYSLFIIYYSLFFLIPNKDLWGQKILKDTLLHVVKSFQPTIADAYKINDAPLVKDSVPPPPQLSYSIQSKNIFTPFTVDPIKPAKMVGEPLPKLYNTLVKAGAGTYLYGEGFFNNLRSKEISYGAHVKHLSWNGKIDERPSGFSNNLMNVYGKKILYKHTVSANLDYNRDAIHYYGYDTSTIYIDNSDYIQQTYSTIGGNAALQSHFTDSVRVNYLAKLTYYNLSDNYKASENNVNAEGNFSGYYDHQLVNVPVIMDFYNNKSDSDTANSVLFHLNPHLLSSGDKWNTRIGMGVAIEGNQNDKSRFLFYPSIDFNYNISHHIIIPYAGVTGGLKKNSLKTLTEVNPFLVPDPLLKNTHTKWDLYAGLRGSISKSLTYNTRASFGKIQDLFLFANDNRDVVKKGFDVVYDDGDLLNLHGELQYQHTEKIKVIAKGDYNKYTMEREQYAWHRPELELSLGTNYNLKNKIVLNTDVFVVGKRFSYTPSQGQGTGITIISSSIKELKPVVDANLGIEYRYSKKLSAFLNLNHLAFKRYDLWNNYPSQSFNFLAGVSVVF